MASPDRAPAASRLAGVLDEAQRQLDRGDHAEAIAALDRALADPDAHADPAAQRQALRTLAFAHIQLGAFDRALPPALACARLDLASDADGAGAARALAWLGLCHGLLGDLARGEPLLRAGCLEARRAGHADTERSALNNLVHLNGEAIDGLRAAGREAEARVRLARMSDDVGSMSRLVPARDPYFNALWAANHAGWLRRVGEPERARQGYEQAYLEALPHGWVEVARQAALGLGLVVREQRDADSAVRWLARAVAVADTADPCSYVSAAHARLAELHDAAGDAAAAARHRAHRLALIDRLQEQRRRTRAMPPPSFEPDQVAAEAGLPLAQWLDRVENEARSVSGHVVG